MPERTYSHVSGHVRRATVKETDDERARREARAKAWARLQQEDELPDDAPEWARMLWEHVRAIETVMRPR